MYLVSCYIEHIQSLSVTVNVLNMIAGVGSLCVAPIHDVPHYVLGVPVQTISEMQIWTTGQSLGH